MVANKDVYSAISSYLYKENVDRMVVVEEENTPVTLEDDKITDMQGVSRLLKVKPKGRGYISYSRI